MKEIIRKYCRKLLFKLVPETSMLIDKRIEVLFDSRFNFDLINSESIDCSLNSTVKIIEPFRHAKTTLGNYSYIARNSIVSLTTIGKFCSIGPNLICGWGIHPLHGISTSPMFYSTQKQNGISLTENDKIEERKPIVIGNDVFIGANVTILDGITIGDGAVIGAGAVVSKNIPPYAIAVGNPIKVIKYRFETGIIEKLLRIKWWEFEDEKLQDVEYFFNDIDAFIQKYDN